MKLPHSPSVIMRAAFTVTGARLEDFGTYHRSAVRATELGYFAIRHWTRYSYPEIAKLLGKSYNGAMRASVARFENGDPLEQMDALYAVARECHRITQETNE